MVCIDNTENAIISTINQNLTNCTVNGSVIGAEQIENNFNNLQDSKASSEVTNLLGQLLTESKVLSNKVLAKLADD